MRDLASSPAAVLFTHLGASIANIAPERATDAEKLVEGVEFVLSDNPGLAFSANPAARRVGVPVRGVEFLWVQSYAMWVIYQETAKRGSKPSPLSFADHPDTAPLAVLLPWAKENELRTEYVDWPALTPVPDISPIGAGEPSAARVASEIALCATAWILHHELAHIALEHPLRTTNSVQEELEADKRATHWILDEAPSGYATIKRGLGIAAATVSIAALDLVAGRSPGVTHPHPAARINRAVNHPALAKLDAVHAAAAVLLGMYLQSTSSAMMADGPFDTAQEWLDQMCYVLARTLK